MDRATLAWYSCSICGRKGATVECMHGARRITLCPHCAVILAGRGARCVPAGGVVSRVLARVAVRRIQEEEAETLISRVESRLKSSGARRRSRSRRRYSAGAT